MSIKKYITFDKVVTSGSITRAAAELGHTQSGVTQLINALEKDLGVILLQRGRNGITLTEHGKTLYPHIRRILEAYDTLTETASSLSSDIPLLRIGAFNSVAVNWLPILIQEYEKYSPGIRFELVDSGYQDTEAALLNHSIDVGFVPLPVSGKCKSISLYQDRMLAVLPKNHAASVLSKCPVTLFETEPVINYIERLNRDASTIYEQAGIHANIKYTVEDDYALLAMVEKGLGISIIPELMLKNVSSQVVAMELTPPAYREIGIAYLDKENTSQAAKSFAAFVVQELPKLSLQ